MNAFQRLAIPALLGLASLPSLAASQVVEAIAKPAQIRCNTSPAGNVNVVHADKIIFMLGGALQAVNPADQVALDKIPRNSELDIKVLDDPTTIADLRGKVLSFIGAVDNLNARTQVKIIDVDYSMVCPVKPFVVPAAQE